jgi:hypothetical protein
MLIIVKLKSFLCVNKSLKGLPSPLLAVILPEDQKLPTNYVSVLVLHFATVSDISIGVYTKKKVKSFKL